MPKAGPVYCWNANTPERFNKFMNHPDVIKKLDECGIIALKLPFLTNLSGRTRILDSARYKSMLAKPTDFAIYKHSIYSKHLLGINEVEKKDLQKEREKLGARFSSYEEFCAFSNKIQDERDESASIPTQTQDRPFILTKAAAKYGYDKLPPKEVKFWTQLFHKGSIAARRSIYGIHFQNLMQLVKDLFNFDNLRYCELRKMLVSQDLGPIRGCTNYLTYSATEQSMAAIHIEDADMTSQNLQLADNNQDNDPVEEEYPDGYDDEDFVLDALLIREEMNKEERPGKVWYGMPASEHPKVRKEICTDYKKSQPDDPVTDTDPEYLVGARDKFIFPDPAWLESKGITVYRIVQKPGYMVITGPKAAHQVINLNSSVNVASNYGTQNWAENYLHKSPASNEGISEEYKELFHRLANKTLRTAVPEDEFYDVVEEEKELCVELREKIVGNGVDFEMRFLSPTQLIRAPNYEFCEKNAADIERSGIAPETFIWIYILDANGECDWSVLEAGLRSGKYHAELISGSQRVRMYADLLKKPTHKAIVFANCLDFLVVKLVGHSIQAEGHTTHPRELTSLLRMFRRCQEIHFKEKCEELGIKDEFPIKNLPLNVPHVVDTEDQEGRVLRYGIVPIMKLHRDNETVIRKLKIALPEFLEPMDDTLRRILGEIGDFMNFPLEANTYFYQLCERIETGEIDVSGFRITNRSAGNGIFNCHFSLSILKDLSQPIEGLSDGDVRSARLQICLDKSVKSGEHKGSGGIELAREAVPDHPLIKDLLEAFTVEEPDTVPNRKRTKKQKNTYQGDNQSGPGKKLPKSRTNPSETAKKPKRDHKKIIVAEPEIQITGVNKVTDGKVTIPKLRAASSAINSTMADLLMTSFKASVYHEFFVGEGDRNELMLCYVVGKGSSKEHPNLVYAVSYGQFLLGTTEYSATDTTVKLEVGKVPSLSRRFVKKHAGDKLLLNDGIEEEMTQLVQDAFVKETLDKFCGLDAS